MAMVTCMSDCYILTCKDELCLHFSSDQIIFHLFAVMTSIFAPPSPGPDCVAMAPNATSNALIVEAVLVMIPWLAFQGVAAADKLEDAKECLNRACQLLSVHGMWSWLPRLVCILTRTSVALHSEVADIDGIRYQSWDYARPSQTVLDAVAPLSRSTTLHWHTQLGRTADFLESFAKHLVATDKNRIWSTIKHAVDGCRDLQDLVGIHISLLQYPRKESGQ